MASTAGGEPAAEQSDATAAPAPAFDTGATGLRKRGDTAGGTSLTAAASEVVEVYWSVENADLVRLLRDGEQLGEPDRATDECFPLWLAGLAPGEHRLELVAGALSGDDIAWAGDASVSLTLTLTPALVVTAFSGEPDPDDGKDHLPQDLQLDDGAKVKLRFTAPGAKQVRITATADGQSPSDYTPVDVDGDGNGELLVDPAGVLTAYTAVALDGDAKSDAAGPVTAHFHGGDDVVSAVVTHQGGGAARLELLDATGAAPDEGRLRLGAGGGLQLRWAVEGATKASLIATSLLQKEAARADPPLSANHVSNDQLAAGLELLLSATGAGGGVIVVDPGPTTSTEYSLSVVARDAEPVEAAKVTAYVANFNVQLRLPSGELVKNQACVLQIAGRDPIGGMTNSSGELWLWVPNTAGEGTLRAVDGAEVLATWSVSLEPQDGVGDGVVALDLQKPAAESAL